MSIKTLDPPRLLGPYRIEERLGAGGMGEVYRAFDDRLRRRVAIKHGLPGRASPRSRARFRREAQAVASLSHSAIVQIFDVVESPDGDWIVMEYVDGPTVASLLEDGPLLLGKALTISSEVAEGLAEAHEEGIVHRDLKTQNVMLTAKGRTKLLDFGLAKVGRHDADEDPRITVEGEILGTWRAMSPEQVRGVDVGPRSDLFSLGTMIYEMVTARSPFQADTRLGTVSRILEHRPLSVRQLRPDVPKELSDLVDRLLEKSPDARPESARLVAAELAAIGETVRRRDEEAARGLVEPLPAPRQEVSPGSTVAVLGTDTGERRQVTVMSCELAPAAGGEPLDPEEQLQLMPLFEQMVRQALEPFGGHFEGESAMSMNLAVIFGFPRANADDPRRAALAALEVVERFKARRGRFDRPGAGGLHVRIGIHTGTAVVAPGSTASGDPQLVLGETAGLAADLRSLARADTAVMGEATYQLLRGAFTFESRRAELPAGPISVHQVLEGSEAIPYAEIGLGRLVAQVSRSQELEQILERWQLAREGMGQVVLLSGEAGIGKTRLVKSLKGRLTGEVRNLIECRCTPFHKNSSYFPLIDFLHRVVAEREWLEEFERTREPPAGASVSREASDSGSAELPLTRFLPRLSTLLETPHSTQTQSLTHVAEAGRQRVIELLVALMMEMAVELPVVFVIEDLHWIDPSSLELLKYLVEEMPTARILLVLSFRRSFEPPWHHPYPSHMTHLSLTRLRDQEVEVLIDRLAEGRPLTAKMRREILRRADGVPLFVEELTRLVLDSLSDEAEPSPAEVIPATLQGWLTMRLDRLGSAKSVAQLAAALGREFSYELLRELSPLEEAELRRELDHLVAAELLHRKGLRPRVVYTFKHALIREAAHESMLRSTRKRSHRRIAHVLEERFPDMVEREPELLAFHYTEAEMTAKAAACWRRAAECAVRAANHTEACDHARRGLQVLHEMPDGAERREHELALRTFLGLALAADMGYHAPEVERCYTRARELWPSVKKVPRLFPILDALVLFFLARSQLDVALEMAEDLRRRAEAAGDAEFLPFAYWSLGWVHLLAGDFAASRFSAEEGIAFHATQLSLESRLPTTAMGLAAATSLGDLSWSLWFLGYPDQAREMSRLSLEMSDSSSDGYTRAFALFRAGYLHVFLGELDATRALAEELISFSQEGGFLVFVALGVFLKGRVLALEGTVEEGLALMSGGIDGLWASGRSAGRLRNLALLAEVCGTAELVVQGLSLLREAATGTEESGDRHYEAEIHRLQGELLRCQGSDTAEVEPCFRRAIDVARGQGARSLELRAAMSLYRLRPDDVEARDVLKEVYDGFTEGFETVDLKAAATLLDPEG